jgi:hypothetical protein
MKRESLNTFPEKITTGDDMPMTMPLTIAQGLLQGGVRRAPRHRIVTSLGHKRPHEPLDSNAVAAS